MTGRTDLEQLVYQMSADMRSLERANKAALGNVDRSAMAIQRRYDKLGKEMGQSFGRTSLLAGVAFGAITAYATKAASDASETANAFQVAFGGLTDQAAAFAKSYSKDVGRAFDETQATMARTQLVLTGVGVAAEQALGMTEAIQRRAIDIGSLFNVEDAQAYQAILSGIAGEAEPMKKFGVAVNEAAVKAELLRLGFKGNAEQAPEAAKAIARLNIILAQSSKADGDAIRTKDGLANSVKAAKAEFRDAAVELGNNFIPTAAKAAKGAAELLGEFNKLPDSVKLTSLALLGLVAAGGPLAATIAGLIKLVQYAGAARLALAGIAGTAAGGAALAAVPVVGAVGFGVNATKRYNAFKGRASLSDSKVRAGLSDAELQTQLIGLKADETKNAKAGRTSYATAIIKKVEADLAARANAVADAAVAKAGAPAAASSNFGLSPNLMKPIGPGKVATGKSAAEKAADTERREADRYNTELARLHDQELAARQGQNLSIRERAQIELDRIGSEQKAYADDVSLAHDVGASRAKLLIAAKAQTSAAERAAVEAQRDADLKAEGVAQANELADLNIRMLEISAATADSLLERLAIEERILALRQDQERRVAEQALDDNPNLSPEAKAARRDGLAQAQVAERGGLRDTAAKELKGGILDAIEASKEGFGGLADFFGDRIRSNLKDRLADLAADFLLNIAKSKAGSTVGSLAKVAVALLGHRETGGPVRKGVPVITGENGQEVFTPSADGRIISNSALRKMGSGVGVSNVRGGDVYLAVTVNADGAIPREEIQGMVQRGALQAVQAARGLTRGDIARSGQQRLGRR